MSGSTPQKPSGQGPEGTTEGVLFGSFEAPIATDSPLHIKDHGVPQHQQPPRGSPQTSFQSSPSTQYNAGYQPNLQSPGSPQLQGGYPNQQTPPKQTKTKLNPSSSAFIPGLKPNAPPFNPAVSFYPTQQPFYPSPNYTAPPPNYPPQPVFQGPFPGFPMGYQQGYAPQGRFYGGVTPSVAPISVAPKKVLEIRNPDTNEIVDLNAKSTPAKPETKPEEAPQEVKEKKEAKPEAQPEPTTPEIRSEPDVQAPQEVGEGQKKKEKKKKEFPLENEEAIAQEQKEKEQKESEQREKEQKEKEQREQEEQDREQREREAERDSQQEGEEDDGQYDYPPEEEYEEPPFTVFVKFERPPPEYPAGVWEPKTQTGSKKYDLDFLLQFQFYDEKPADFKPPQGFATPDKPRVKSHYIPKPRPPPPQQNPRGRVPMPNGGRGRGPPPNFPPPANVKPLVQSENRWVRQSFVQSSDDEATFRKYRGLLNKLTVERFDAIAKEILDIEIPSALILRGLIHLIFDKATDEPNFAFMYANLCERVQKQKESLNFEGNNFRRLLLNKCQEEFEQKPGDEMNQLTDEDKKNMTEAEIEDYEYKRSKLKRRALGNITFIGELFKLSMLTEKIMHDCVTRLLGKGNDTDERDIECLCNLLKTVGKMLDVPKAEKVFQTYFERIRFLSTSERLPSRIRFMLMDTIDLRSNKWTPRREELKAKKIDEVRQEVIEEENRKSSGGSGSGSRGGDNRRSSGRGGMPNIGQQIGMRRTPSQGLPVKPKTEVADISKLHSYQKKTEQETPGTRSFAPPSFKKTGPVPKAAPTPAATSNKFSALMDEPKSTREPRSYDNSRSEPRQAKEQVKVEKVPEPVVVAPPMDNEKFNTTVTNNFEEYLQTKSNDDAEQYMAELKGCEIWFGELVSTVVNFVIEKKTEQQALAVRFLSFLLSKNILTVSHVVSGLHSSLEILDDLVVDIPGSIDFFARLLFGLATEGSLSLVFLNSLPALRTQESSKKLLASLFKLLVSQKGETGAAETLFRSAVDLSSLLGEDATPFLEKQSLGFLAKRSFANELTEKFLDNSDSALQFIRKEFDEATLNSPGFGFVLMSAFLTTLEKEPNNLGDRLRVLYGFLSEKEQLQIQALNAFQSFHQENRLQEDRIDSILNDLYQANVLSEKSLNQWKAEASIFPGKEELLAKLSKFFDWLSKAEPEPGN